MLKFDLNSPNMHNSCPSAAERNVLLLCFTTVMKIFLSDNAE